MSKHVTIEIFTFDELNDKAKDKARAWWLEHGLDYKWFNDTYEDAKEIGLKITSFDLDCNRHAKGEFVSRAFETAEKILKDHVESCETYKTAKAFIEVLEKTTGEEEITELEDNFLKSLLGDYWIILQKEYENSTSDEYVDENIKCNEYMFNANGTVFKL